MSLRQEAIKGGAFLLLRQALGIVISVTGVLLVARIIGPRQYGLFAAGAGIVSFLYVTGTWGLDVCLLRSTQEPAEAEFRQAFTLLLLISVVLVVAIATLRHLIAACLRMPEESSLLPLLALAIPLNLLALRGVGAWAPAAGLLVQQAGLLTLSYSAAKFRPGLLWERGLARRMLRHGLSYSSSIWVYQLRDLVNPIVVGRFAGAEAVGYVAIGVRIAALLSFAKSATWRIAMPAFARLDRDARRLRNAIIEGMRFQAVAVGFPLASFALLAPFLIPLGFGHHWASAVKVFPFIALSYLSNAMFNLHSSVLYMLGKNLQVTWFHIVHIALFAAGAALFVPQMGFVGYGWAEVLALLSYPVIHLFLARAVGNPRYEAPAIWYATAVSVIALGAFGVPALYLGFAVLFAPLLFRKERATLAGYAQIFFSRAAA